eukprot:scaffold9607_cov24-Prasinocladus_malaysianus.AAC.3
MRTLMIIITTTATAANLVHDRDHIVLCCIFINDGYVFKRYRALVYNRKHVGCECLCAPSDDCELSPYARRAQEDGNSQPADDPSSGDVEEEEEEEDDEEDDAVPGEAPLHAAPDLEQLLGGLTKAELKSALKKRGLAVSGTKEELVHRLARGSSS